ncbi:MAG: tautomerase family protein [Gracilibacteraceae bacterium]|jgi:4-oxalocrotonate tautomerase|nr:tautomerase family protein [Gracilibacteraceae bacterium]
MPVITLEISKYPKEKKAALVKELVTKASEITGVPAQAFVTLIKESDPDNVGLGTELLSDKH